MQQAEKIQEYCLEGGHLSHDLFRDALNALGERIAILDARGMLIWVNRAWRQFAARADAPSFVAVEPGVNYLDVCRRAATAHPVAHDTLYGIYSALEGLLERFSIEYSIELNGNIPGWYQMTACPIHDGPGGVILTHREITSQKLAEQERDRLNRELQFAMNDLHGLASLLPVCGVCGCRRDDDKYLQQVEAWFLEHPQAGVFGTCPECHERLFSRHAPAGDGPVQQDLFILD